jgi:hypothetical protein
VQDVCRLWVYHRRGIGQSQCSIGSIYLPLVTPWICQVDSWQLFGMSYSYASAFDMREFICWTTELTSSQISRWIFNEHEISEMELQRDPLHGKMGQQTRQCVLSSLYIADIQVLGSITSSECIMGQSQIHFQTSSV